MKRWSPIPPVGNREFYDRIAATDYGKMMLEEAESILPLPLPEPTEELYRQSFVTRDRAKYEAQILGLNQQARTMAIALLLKPADYISPPNLELFSERRSHTHPPHHGSQSQR